MVLIIVIFFIATTIAFGMLAFRAWEIRTNRVNIPENIESGMPDMSFRHIEKIMLYLTKHVVQGIVLTVAKYWFILVTKAKKWVEDKLPKIHSYFEGKSEPSDSLKKTTFVRRAILESQAKIKRIKEKVKKEHES